MIIDLSSNSFSNFRKHFCYSLSLNNVSNFLPSWNLLVSSGRKISTSSFEMKREWKVVGFGWTTIDDRWKWMTQFEQSREGKLCISELRNVTKRVSPQRLRYYVTFLLERWITDGSKEWVRIRDVLSTCRCNFYANDLLIVTTISLYLYPL